MKINNATTPQLSAMKKQPSFGSAGSLSQKLLSGGTLRKFSDAIEYNKYAMSSTSLLGLFYFAVVVPRYIQAYDKYDRYEILRRDLISLTALTFMAKALSKGFSEVCSKSTGFVLNHKPKNFENPLVKLKNYIAPEGEFQALGSDEIVSKYSKIHEYKNGIVDFCEFINKEKNGDIKKVLAYDKGVKANVEKLISKPIEKVKYNELIEAFKKAEGTDTMKAIYKAFESPSNAFVKHAKTMNSSFGFLSVFLLTPALIVWISKSNEKITKKRIMKEMAEKKARAQVAENPMTPILNDAIKSAQNSSSLKTKETFAYFLGDKKS